MSPTRTPSQWSAAFIGTGRPAEADDPALYLRKEFTVAPGLVSASLHVTALGVIEPYLNGNRVGDEVLEPGWTSYAKRLQVRQHDVTSMLGPGVNALGSIVGEGWAVGRIGYPPLTRRRIFADQVGGFLQLELHYGDRVEVIASDESFRAGSGSIRANSIYDGQVIDKRCEAADWATPGFDDTRWSPAKKIDRDHSSLVPAHDSPIRRMEELRPVSITSTPRGSVLVDFGQNIAGWVRLRVSGDSGTEITLRHAELVVDGLPDYETLRSAKATDCFILSGAGVEEFEPTLTYHGFRYVELEGHPGDLSAEDIRAVVIHSDMDRTGWFETSDSILNKLHDNVVWSMRGNFVGLPTDCPQRDERLGYTGDINAFAPTASFLYDVRNVLGSWLEDVAAEQRSRGYVPSFVPEIKDTPDAVTALWSDAAVSVPWSLYQEYGDADILARSYESMAALTRSIEDLLDENALWSKGFQLGDWLDPDAPAENPMAGKTDPHLVASAYFARVSRQMAQTAALLGKNDDAAHFQKLAERTRTAFQAEYVTPNGRVSAESTTGYALAITFDLLDPQQRQVAGDRLAELVEKSEYRISTGFAGTPFLLSALSDTGHTDAAFRVLQRRESPSFLYPVMAGATTVWERWDAVMPDGTLNSTGMTSLNHYAFGAVASWLHQVIGGLVPTAPGYRSVRIAPRPGAGLTYAHVAHETDLGRIEVRWELTDGTMAVEATIPEGIRAELVLPSDPSSRVIEVEAGTHTWTYDAQAGDTGFSAMSTLEELAGDPQVWVRLSAAFGEEVAQFPLDALLEHASSSPFATVAAQLPLRPGGLERLTAIITD